MGLGHHKLQDLSAHDVRYAINELKQDFDRRDSHKCTLQKCYQILSTCLNCAKNEKLILHSPIEAIDKPKYTPKETVIWTTEQAAHFLHTSKGHPKYIAFLLLLTYGIRRGEALGLRWCDIDFNNGLIHIRQQISWINGRLMARNLKTKNSRRALPLTTKVRAALLEHAKKSDGVIPPFNPNLILSTVGMVMTNNAGKAIMPKCLEVSFHSLTRNAGLPRIKIHAMRHTASTIFKDCNVPVKDVQMILGHANISTTLNIYQHGTPENYGVAISAVEGQLLPG